MFLGMEPKMEESWIVTNPQDIHAHILSKNKLWSYDDYLEKQKQRIIFVVGHTHSY